MKGRIDQSIDEYFMSLFYRNLALIRRLEEQSLVWVLLEMISTGNLSLNLNEWISIWFLDNNAFQLCLPVIRCLLSALIVQWENLRGEDRSRNYPKQLTLSTNLIILLKKVVIIFIDYPVIQSSLFLRLVSFQYHWMKSMNYFPWSLLMIAIHFY